MKIAAAPDIYQYFVAAPTLCDILHANQAAAQHETQHERDNDAYYELDKFVAIGFHTFP